MECQLGIKTQLKHILVRLGSYNKMPWLENRNLFLVVLEVGSWLEVGDQGVSMME